MRCGVAVLLALVAAHPLARGAEPPPAPLTCADSAGGLQPQRLETVHAEKRGRIALDATAQCLGGVAGFPVAAVLLELPAFTEPYSVRVFSLVGGTFAIPRLELLDAQFARTRQFAADDFTRRGDSISLEVFVDADNAADRYLLAYVDPERIGTGDARRVMSVNANPYFYMWTGAETQQVAQAVDSGRLVVELVGERWKKKKRK
jgi:hypothetical protein